MYMYGALKRLPLSNLSSLVFQVRLQTPTPTLNPHDFQYNVHHTNMATMCNPYDMATPHELGSQYWNLSLHQQRRHKMKKTEDSAC